MKSRKSCSVRFCPLRLAEHEQRLFAVVVIDGEVGAPHHLPQEDALVVDSLKLTAEVGSDLVKRLIISGSRQACR